MQYFPLFADLKDRDCLVVGGGIVAQRRTHQLLAAGARPTLIAPSLTPELAELVDTGQIRHDARPFGNEDLTRYWLVVAATDDEDVNRLVAETADRAKRWCNVVDDPARSSFIMPTVIDRDPVTIAVSSSGRSPVIARWIKGLIEAVLPARIDELATLAGRWRERVKEALPDFDERLRFWQAVVDGPVADEALAGRDAEAALEAALTAWREESAARSGEAWFVGAGPGDPDLITLRGRRLLATADAVLYDRLVNPRLLDFARRDAELICVGKTAGKPSIKQVQINRLLVRLVSAGKRVCRLKGGDPMVFSRIGEELEALTIAGLPFQIVPGISAVEGCAAYAGIPLTLRGSSQAILITTGHTMEHVSADLSSFRPGQTLALYMGVAHFASIAAHLIDDGHAATTPIAIVENGSTDRQRVLRATLGSLTHSASEHRIESPALLLVGDTTRMADRYGWFAKSRLEGNGDVKDGLAQVS